MVTVQNSLLVALGQIIYYATFIYVWIIIIRVLLTWIRPNPNTPLMRFLSRLTDPALNWGRRKAPLVLGGLDFSPIVVLIGLQLIGTVLGQWLISLGVGAPALMLAPLVILGFLSMLDSLAWLLVIVMGIRLIMSLVHPSPYSLIVQVVYGLTEPLLAPLRRFLPPGPRGLDLRPLAFLLITLLIQHVVLGSLHGTARQWMAELTRGIV